MGVTKKNHCIKIKINKIILPNKIYLFYHYNLSKIILFVIFDNYISKNTVDLFKHQRRLDNLVSETNGI